MPVPTAVLDLLRSRGDPEPDDKPPPSPLRIRVAVRSQAEFDTDRGRRLLPAWQLSSDGLDGEIWVLDREAVEIWTPPEPAPAPPSLLPASHGYGGGWAQVDVGPDDRTLTYGFIGGSPEWEHYREVEVIQSDRAVAIAPKRIGPGGPTDLRGYSHSVTVNLREPLGARVFVDQHGHAGQATTAP